MLAGNLLIIEKHIRNKREMAKKSTVFSRGKENKKQNESIENKDSKLNNANEVSGKSETSSNDCAADDFIAEKGSTDNETDKPVEGIDQIEVKLADMQDRYIRLSAEFDNYRKRTLREKIEISRYAGEDLLIKIIPLMDDFDRALAHMDTATDCLAMKNGIDLIYGKFSEFLKQSGIKEIESIDTPFNVDLHEAVAKVQVEDDDKKGKVVDVVVKGYYLQDKILRFSKVVVGE